MDCVFCAIVRGEAPASLVHEDETCVCFMDGAPVSAGHLLVVPREHARVGNGSVTDLQRLRQSRPSASSAR